MKVYDLFIYFYNKKRWRGGGGGSEHSNESVRDLINHNCYLNSTKALVDNTQKREILSYALPIMEFKLETSISQTSLEYAYCHIIIVYEILVNKPVHMGLLDKHILICGKHMKMK
jgi:hypothetical protein